MKRLLICCLILLLALPAQAASPPDLKGLSLEQLESLKLAADQRIRQLRLPDAEGYYEIGGGESQLRQPEAHLNEKIRLSGELFAIQPDGEALHYFLSLTGYPERVFRLSYQPKPDEPRLLPGDSVRAYGLFLGLHALDTSDPLSSGAGLVDAQLIIREQAMVSPLAAPPYAGTRQDPVPLGVIAHYESSYWSGYANFEIQLLELSRGSAAQKKAKAMSNYNISAPRTQEWYIVSLRVKALSAPGERAPIQSEDFRFVSRSGSEYRHHFLINDTQGLRSLYVGGEQTATIACLIDKDDMPLIVYQAESLNPLWFDAGLAGPP